MPRDWIAGLAGTQFTTMLERACRTAGFTPRIVHRADDAVMHETLAAAGLGVGLLPALACTGSKRVRCAQLAPPLPCRHLSTLVRRGAARRPAVGAALDALRRAAGSRAQPDA